MLFLFQRRHFLKTSDEPFVRFELSSQKHFDQIPSQGRACYPTSHTHNIHVIIFNSLMSGERICDQCCPYPRHLVGCNASPDTTAADGQTPGNFTF